MRVLSPLQPHLYLLYSSEDISAMEDHQLLLALKQNNHIVTKEREKTVKTGENFEEKLKFNANWSGLVFSLTFADRNLGQG